MVKGDAWSTVEAMLLAYPTTLRNNSLVAMYRSGSQRQVREAGAHRVERPLGFYFSRCGRRGCPAGEKPGSIIGDYRNERVRISCKTCTWRSRWISLEELERKQYFFRLHPTLAPMIFYHDFPAPAGISDLFFQ